MVMKFAGGEIEWVCGEFTLKLVPVPYLVFLSKVGYNESGTPADGYVSIIPSCVVDAVGPGEIQYEMRQVGPSKRRCVAWDTICSWPHEMQVELLGQIVKIHTLSGEEAGK